jgi:hexosaminidase
VQYRIPPPGAVIRSGLVHANVAYPGLEIRYTRDGTEPTSESPLYETPIPFTGTMRLRTFDTTGRGSRIVNVENADVRSQ